MKFKFQDMLYKAEKIAGQWLKLSRGYEHQSCYDSPNWSYCAKDLAVHGGWTIEESMTWTNTISEVKMVK